MNDDFLTSSQTYEGGPRIQMNQLQGILSSNNSAGSYRDITSSTPKIDMQSQDSGRGTLKEVGNYCCPVRDTPIFNIPGGSTGGKANGARLGS